MFIDGYGNWTQYRALGKMLEIDFHKGKRSPEVEYQDAMAQVLAEAREALERGQREGYQYVMLVHGNSTSRPGQTTSRSQIRGLMRSTEATPFIDRRKSIQHETVFVAAIRPKLLEAFTDESKPAPQRV